MSLTRVKNITANTTVTGDVNITGTTTTVGPVNVGGGNLSVNPTSEAAHRYLYLNTGATNDGHILFQRAGAPKFQISADTNGHLFTWNYAKNGTSFRVNTDGSVITPHQPMFDAYLSSNVTHPAGNYNMSTGDAWTARTNIGSHFSSGTFTAPIAGKYLFCAGINAGHPIGSMTYFSCEFQVNGTRRHIHWFGKGGSSASYAAANNTAIISLSASDYVRLHTEKSHGCTVIGGSGYTHFGGMLVG